jgi:predicted RNase H-like nuclease (RuvC/YqgF family)
MLRSCCMAMLVVFGMQSLVDAAREEAERRKSLERQGIHGKVIEGNPSQSAPNRDLSVSTGPPATQTKTTQQTVSRNAGSSLRHLRTTLQKLDRNIRQTEERLGTLRGRYQTGRWPLPKVGRLSKNSQPKDTQAQLQKQIEDLQLKLDQMLRERRETYDEGRKADFLPGELDGKGIIP